MYAHGNQYANIVYEDLNGGNNECNSRFQRKWKKRVDASAPFSANANRPRCEGFVCVITHQRKGHNTIHVNGQPLGEHKKDR